MRHSILFKGKAKWTIFLRRSMHILGFGIILIFPVGIYRDNPDSTNIAISGHIGSGQYGSILYGCDGPIHGEGNDFNDMSFKASLAIPPGINSPVVIGLAGGKWRSPSFRYPGRMYSGSDYIYYASAPQEVKFEYLNPSISYEDKMAGFGVGYISGRRPIDLSPDGMNMAADFTFHLRFGDPGKYYFITSLNENAPLVSGGGYYDIGLGWALRGQTNIYLGMSAGLYDWPGILAQLQVPVNRHFLLSGAVRYGSVANVSEYGFSGGLIGRF